MVLKIRTCALALRHHHHYHHHHLCHLMTTIFLISSLSLLLFPLPVSSRGGQKDNNDGRGGGGAGLPNIHVSQPGLGALQVGETGGLPQTPNLDELGFFPEPVDIPVTCSMRSSCQAEGREALPYRDVNCFCDPLCEVFGDCCKDRVRPNPPINIGDVTIKNKMFQCERLMEYNQEVEIYIVSSCPKTFGDPEVIRSCVYSSDNLEDYFYRLPVSGILSGILYKNYYCAQCAGEKDVSFWSVDIDCDHPPDTNVSVNAVAYMEKIVQESNYYKCHRRVSHPTIPVRKCKSAISRCMKGANKKLKKKCKKETSYVYAGMEVFKNKYCAQCYGVNESTSTCEDTRVPKRGGPGTDFGGQRVSRFYLNLDFNNGKGVIQDLRVDVRGERHVSIPFAEIRECESHEMYDPFAKRCRMKDCPRGSQLMNGQCVIVSSNPTPGNPKMREPRPNRPNQGVEIETPDGTSLGVEFPGMGPSMPLPDPPEDEQNTLDCPVPVIKLSFGEFEMFKNGSVKVYAYGKVFGVTDYNYQGPFLYICIQSPLPSGGTGGGEGGGRGATNPNPKKNRPNLGLNPTNPKTNNGPRTTTNGKNMTSNSLVMFQFNRRQGLVSFVTVLVSLVAMLIMFIVYLMLPPLRNVPGKNIMCLAFSLFTAQILFLVGVPRTEWFEVCLGLAAAMHYFWLAAFFWMNVMAFDIWRTFVSRVNKTSEKAKTCRFVGYSLYAWFMPALIVAAALVLDFKVFEGIDEMYLPHYGTENCWIAHRHALLFLFALPLAILFLIGMIFFLATMINICRICRMSDVQNRGKDRCRLCIYIKLSLVMGLTWAFGFLAALLKMELFWYLFIGFNAFQGVFICFAFVLNKKVFKLLSSKGRNNNRRQQTSDFRACSNGVRGGPGSSATNRSYFSDSSAKVIAQETSI